MAECPPAGTVAFMPFFNNLAESTRLVRVARAFSDLGGRPVCLSHGGDYERLAIEAGLQLHRVAPVYTGEQVDRLMRLDRMEEFGDPFEVGELLDQVRHERDAYQEHGVRLVVTGFNLPCSLSAPAAGIPLVWILAGTSYPQYFEAGLATVPDMYANWLVRALPRRLTTWLTSRLALKVKEGTHAFNEAARRLGVPEFPNSVSMWTGDHNLVSDLPEALSMPAAHDYPPEDYVGPLLAHLDLDLDDELAEHLQRPGRHIYFAMGSSGEKQVYLDVLGALASTGHNIVAAYTTILDPDELPDLDNRILLRDFVPAERVNRLVDLAVLHGGQGTVYTAAYSGRPMIGIPMQFEQQYNIDMLVRHGMAIRLPRQRLRPRHVTRAVARVFDHYESYHQAAQQLAHRLPDVNGATRAALRLADILHSHHADQ